MHSLEQRRDNLQQLAEHWDGFENGLHGWEKALGRLEDKFRNVDPTVRSRRHLEDTKNAIQVSAVTPTMFDGHLVLGKIIHLRKFFCLRFVNIYYTKM